MVTIAELRERAIAEGPGSEKLQDLTQSQQALRDAVHDECIRNGVAPTDAEALALVEVRRAIDEARRMAGWELLAGHQADELLTVLDSVRHEAQPCIATSISAAVDVLAVGRFHNQFESGTSSALFDPRVRAIAEMATFDVALDAPSDVRPVYGYVATQGRVGQNSVRQYGCVRMVLHSSAREHMTMTVGDSLNWSARPVTPGEPLDARRASDAVARRESVDRGLQLLQLGLHRYQDLGYFEAQFHRGVERAEIAQIFVAEPRGPRELDDLDALRRAAEHHAMPLRIASEGP